MLRFDEVMKNEEMIEYFHAQNVQCIRFNSPKGLAYELVLEIENTRVKAMFYCDQDLDDYILEMISEEPVDPVAFWEVKKLLRFINTPKFAEWILLDSGHYSFRISSDDLGYLEDIVPTLKRMRKIFCSVDPFIKNVARRVTTCHEMFYVKRNYPTKLFKL